MWKIGDTLYFPNYKGNFSAVVVVECGNYCACPALDHYNEICIKTESGARFHVHKDSVYNAAQAVAYKLRNSYR